MHVRLCCDEGKMTVSYDLVIRNASRLNHQEKVDIGILNGEIVDINRDLIGKGDREIEIDGRLVIPGFVDLHMHLDSQLGTIITIN